MSRQLRPRTLRSYEQTIRLFAVWLRETQAIEDIEDVKDSTVRRYIIIKNR
ncbi:MAG: site-specific integrase [Clostridia bacterium]|nr:site-specific integrase [Clostridia bacterium]